MKTLINDIKARPVEWASDLAGAACIFLLGVMALVAGNVMGIA
jgi:hypothetical protein